MLLIFLLVILFYSGESVENCDLQPISRGQDKKIPSYNPYTQNDVLVITTNSKRGSNERTTLLLKDKKDAIAGLLDLQFGSKIGYRMGYCQQGGAYADFDVSLPTEEKKTWKIALTVPGPRLVITCNDKEVVDFLVSKSTCVNKNWSSWYSQDVTHAKFFRDTASDEYCVTRPAPVWKEMMRKVKTDLDLETSMLQIKTNTPFGSERSIYVQLLTEGPHEEEAGEIGIGFDSASGEYRLGKCREWTDFASTPGTGKDMLWTITKTGEPTKPRIVVTCDGVEVVNVLISDTTCTDNDWTNTWATYWNKDVARMEFKGLPASGWTYSIGKKSDGGDENGDDDGDDDDGNDDDGNDDDNDDNGDDDDEKIPDDCVEKDVDYPGADISWFQGIADLQTCQKKCGDVDGCKSVVFQQSSGNCWLKNKDRGGTPIANTGFQSVTLSCVISITRSEEQERQ